MIIQDACLGLTWALSWAQTKLYSLSSCLSECWYKQKFMLTSPSFSLSLGSQLFFQTGLEETEEIQQELAPDLDFSLLHIILFVILKLKAIRIREYQGPSLYITHVIHRPWELAQRRFCFFFVGLPALPEKVSLGSEPIYLLSIPVYPRHHASLGAQQFPPARLGKEWYTG